jgi:hypothetical protein
MATPSLAMIPSGYKAQKVYSVLPTNGDGDFTFARSGSATRVNQSGLIETVGNNVPRLDYSDGGCPSLLLEPQRTNLVTYSEDFSQSDWVEGNSSIESDTLISPSGLLNGSTLTDNTANTIHRLRDSVSLSASTDYGLSIFAKKGTLSNIQLALINTGNSNTASRVFDLENGALGESITVAGTLSDSKITDYGNGWYRCEITAQLNSTPNTWQVTLATQSSGNTTIANQVTYDGDGNGNVHLWGAMLEQGSYTTSYIPTNGSTVTRFAETCNGAGDADTFNDSEGVLYAEISALADDSTARYFSLNNGSSNRVRFGYGTSTNSVRLFVVSTTTQVDLTVQLSDTTLFNKFAIKYKANDFAIWVNGIEVATDTNANTPVGLVQLNLDNCCGSDNFYGNVKDVRVYNNALSDSELQALTS